MKDAFFKLLQVALGVSHAKLDFTIDEWIYCFDQAQKQCLVAVLFPAIKNCITDSGEIRIKPLFSEWLGLTVQIDARNRLLNERVSFLSKMFDSWGYQSCVLKGQGVAQLYPEPHLRQSGDIDIWVYGGHDNIIKSISEHSISIRNIDYVHSGIYIFDDVEVEVHYRPTWLYNPFTNSILQSFFRNNAKVQFDHFDEAVHFSYPTIGFNLVYSLIHINRHIFEEGIGLRQLLDYYYILEKSSKQERIEAYYILKALHLKRFTGALMYIMHVAFGVKEELLLCAQNQSAGNSLLEDVLKGGNFGRYDDRNKWLPVQKRFLRGFYSAKRNYRYMTLCPSEVLWMPFWKLWHWCWRKKKGYL